LRFTGQRQESGFGLYDYGARYYDPLIGRFVSADSVVPGAGNPQALNRYSYTYNNPLRYVDPSGHWTDDQLKSALGDDWYDAYYGKGGVLEGRKEFLDFLRGKEKNENLLFALGFVLKAMRAASQTGVQFKGDAVGARISASGGAGLSGGISFDAIVNLKAGQFSVFGAPQAGWNIGAGASVVVGLEIIPKLPNNDAYRGGFGSMGLIGVYRMGFNAEHFWSGPMDDDFKSTKGAHGYFGGVAFGAEAGLYGSASYSFEGLRVDKSGTHWLPDPHFQSLDGLLLAPIDVIGAIVQIHYHDFWQNWSRYLPK
jgi:RHS repeat-associated protein